MQLYLKKANAMSYNENGETEMKKQWNKILYKNHNKILFTEFDLLSFLDVNIPISI